MQATMKRRLLPVLGLALAYYVTGKLGLLLAVPPGYATPVWPPSGIALAGILLFGYRVWPGILIGSFAINVGVGFDVNDASAIARSLAIGAGISSGAVLQAVLGGFLIRRTIGFPSPIEDAREVLSFMLLGGPVSCLVNATVGPTILLLAGAVSGQAYPFNWFTWWSGDTLGVLVVTPLILTLAAEPREVWRQRRVSLALPLCLMLAVSIALFLKTSTLGQVRVKQEFDQRTVVLEQAITRSLDGQIEALQAIAHLYDASLAIDRQRFGRFVAGPIARHAGIQAFEWAPRVPHAERAAYEEAARWDGLPGFRIRERGKGGKVVPAGSRAEYFPVSFVEPMAGNERAVGYDMASNPERLAVLERARDGGRPVATGKIPLMVGDGNRPGVLVFMPVYRPGLPHDTVEDRRRNLQGFALVALRVGEMIELTLRPFDRDRIQVAVFDASAPAAEQVLFTEDEDPSAAAGVAAGGTKSEAASELERTATLEFGGREWVLRFVPTAEYMAAHRSWEAWAVLAAALLFTGLLAAMLLMMTGRAAKIEKLVAQRTLELAQANRNLEKSTEELRHKVIELARSNADLEQFAHVASHDLQEPLRMVASYTELLADRYQDRLDQEGHKYIAYAVSGARRMQVLIEDLLSYSRVGRSDPSLEPINCTEVVDRIMRDLKMTIEETGAEVVYRQLPTVRADSTELGHVFQNLIANAVKFRSDEPPRIQIGAKHRKSEWQFSVSDNGIGFDMEFSDRIFEIFRRLHVQRDYPGSGVGLAICKRIIDRHGGRIWAQSAPGKGSTFFFTLPDGLEPRRMG